MSAAAQEKIEAVQAGAESWSAEEVVRWGLAKFSPHAAIASSFALCVVRSSRTRVYWFWMIERTS